MLDSLSQAKTHNLKIKGRTIKASGHILQHTHSTASLEAETFVLTRARYNNDAVNFCKLLAYKIRNYSKH